MEHTDNDHWQEKYAKVFFGDPADYEREQRSKTLLKPAVPGQQGSLNIRPSEAKPVTDLSQFLGRAGGTGKADPNKAALAKVAQSKAAIKIGPDESGNLSLDVPEGT